VGGEGGEARGYGPDVEVMNLDYAPGGHHLTAHLGGIQAVGGCLQ
jgi:hypothetical protein